MHNKKIARLFHISLMTIRKWHWMSAALCFICMLLFSVTGITLHHSRMLLPAPNITCVTGELPNMLLPALTLHAEQKKLAIPEAIIVWLFANKKIALDEKNRTEQNRTEQKKQFSNPLVMKEAASDKLFSASFNRPAVSENITINMLTGEFDYEKIDKGWLAYFNDLHKGKNTGMAWIYFMDIFAIACIIFSVTGFLLLQRYANTRAKTWPLLAAGLFLPIFFMLLLIH